MSWRYFKNQTDNSNKFWKARRVGTDVEKEWGRIGGNISTQTKNFRSENEADRYIENEARKKINKGYEETTSEDLDDEVEVAQALGTRWKIDRIEFIGEEWGKKKKLSFSDNYNPQYGVYVEMLQSWTMEKRYFLVNKADAVEYRDGSITGNKVSLTSVRSPDYNFVEGIRLAIRKMQGVIIEVVGIAAGNASRLLDIDGSAKAKTVMEVSRKLDISSPSLPCPNTQVVSKFASLGSRMLEI